MRLQDIINRIDDCAKILDDNAEKPYVVRDTAGFLRATVRRIRRDADLEAKIAQVTLQHNLDINLEDLKEVRPIGGKP